jgi:rhodanese-related sulfurtransferase
MKSVILAVFLVMLAVTGVLAGPGDVTSREAKTLIEKDRTVFVLDVRTPQETSQGRVPGAVLMPVNEVERRVSEIPKNRPVIVYCAVGSRSRHAANFLSRRGYTNIHNMTDGIVGWQRNGFPVQR